MAIRCDRNARSGRSIRILALAGTIKILSAEQITCQSCWASSDVEKIWNGMLSERLQNSLVGLATKMIDDDLLVAGAKSARILAKDLTFRSS